MVLILKNFPRGQRIFFRNRQYKFHFFTCYRMAETEPECTEEQLRGGSSCQVIFPVTDQRMSHMCHLNTDLMMPAGIQMNFKQGTGTAVSSRSGCKYLIQKELPLPLQGNICRNRKSSTVGKALWRTGESWQRPSVPLQADPAGESGRDKVNGILS